ncbi:putative single-stranded DNA-binding protein 68k chain [Lasiosphaeris hirsuta]|uniref:Replication protein A subunit n=1 Tax=Lasiosphaeris hirsuta TaxID=260670 RepID=A0AA40ARC8_9PEZI|nr:putative single-stranded DNA-binding protein 68k chain [Lasiosphaeris hirsuta]
MAHNEITQGAIDAIFNDPTHASDRFPVPILQCLQVKTLESKAPGNAPERYRLVLSDIRNYVQCMLATQSNHVVHDGLLQRGCIIRMKSYQAQHLKGRSVLIILDLEVISNLGTPEKIGDPAAIEQKSSEPQHNTTMGGAGFYGAKSEPVEDTKPQVQKQMASRPTGNNSGGSSSTQHGGGTLYPIEALSMYSHKWTIKVRVTQKSDIKTWHKATGEGKLFSVNLLDESGEIRATGFNDQVDSFYELLQEGSVYYISTPCKVQLAKKQWSNLPNDYELTFERDTVIEKAEDQTNVPQVRFNFCNIQELQEVEKDATVDVIGVLKEVQEVSQIVSKTTQKPYDKRELILVDDTGFQVRLTIWGKTATSFDVAPESVVAFKGTRVGDFGGRSLSLLSSGTMAVDPDIPEAHRLKGWYDASGRNDTFATHNGMATMGAATGRKDELKSIQDVKKESLGMENVDYFNLKATIVHIRQENFSYPACRNEGCNKKVVDSGDGTWRCEKCNVSHDRPQYRYIMSMSVNDHTGQLWLSAFDDTGRVIMGGKSADELVEIREMDDTRLAAEFEAANCRQFIFRCRAKMDSFGEQPRIRYQVMSIAPLDYKSEGHKLAELIKQMSI